MEIQRREHRVRGTEELDCVFMCERFVHGNQERTQEALFYQTLIGKNSYLPCLPLLERHSVELVLPMDVTNYINFFKDT